MHTERLILRQWQEEDRQAFARMNADPRVMEYFPALLTTAESNALADRLASHIEANGWGLWAATLSHSGEFIGFVGLHQVPAEMPFAPAVEIGWRLAYEHWGQGYATEAALAVLRYGLDVLKLKEIVSFTSRQNQRSRHVMEKIGMHRNPADDFDHPKLPLGHPLRSHVLYRIK